MFLSAKRTSGSHRTTKSTASNAPSFSRCALCVKRRKLLRPKFGCVILISCTFALYILAKLTTIIVQNEPYSNQEKLRAQLIVFNENFNLTSVTSTFNKISILTTDRPKVPIWNSSYTFPLSNLERFRETLPRSEDYMVIGQRREQPSYLTIGIPTVCRKVVCYTYLYNTLSSLLSNLKNNEKNNINIVVFITDFDQNKKREVIENCVRNYPNELNSGLLQLIAVNESVYPPLKNLKRNYGDETKRVSWRSKQVVDFALMFHYAAPLSTYYIQIEDDIVTTPNFVDNIASCIDKQKTWTVLEFSELGFIGKLFRSSDLPRFARFLTMFYDEMPVDFLYIHFFRLLVQQKDIILCKPTIFQHIGDFSSLDLNKKRNLLKDKYFPNQLNISVSLSEEILLGGNPPADIYSTMDHFENNIPRNAYENLGLFFWGKSPVENDSICVLFKNKVIIDSVKVHTGDDKINKDFLRKGKLLISPDGYASAVGEKGKHKCECSPQIVIGEVTNSDFFIDDIRKKTVVPTKCLQIIITAPQTEWLRVNRIQIRSTV